MVNLVFFTSLTLIIFTDFINMIGHVLKTYLECIAVAVKCLDGKMLSYTLFFL